jgi:uncharacterized lipoprotein YmbA
MMPARFVWLLLAVAALATLGCASKGVKPREYLLTPATTAGAGSGDVGDVRIGVGPVTIPSYLDRANLVTRVGDNELAFSDLHRWGESLETGIARVVAANLVLLVPARQVESYPWRTLPKIDYRVTMEIERFERGPDGNVDLDVRWFLGDGKSGRIRQASHSRFSIAAGGRTHADTVAAMSEAAAQLSAEIANVIQQRVPGLRGRVGKESP